MIKQLPLYMLVSLLCTLFIECLLARFLKVKDKYDFLFVVLINLLTNPLVVSFSFFINIRYGLFYRRIWICIFEILVILIEGFLYRKCLVYRKMNSFFFSFLLNCSSYLLGILINSILF